jgi:hypothetical protein
MVMGKPTNRSPSAPEDLLEPGRLFTKDGRKRKGVAFVGAKSPDTDPANAASGSADSSHACGVASSTPTRRAGFEIAAVNA